MAASDISSDQERSDADYVGQDSKDQQSESESFSPAKKHAGNFLEELARESAELRKESAKLQEEEAARKSNTVAKSTSVL